MKSYKTFINEARAGGPLNPRKNIVDNLKPYLRDTDAYITYISHLGSSPTSSGIKVGINPQTTYSTPIGVYAYPLIAAWDEYYDYQGALAVPFGLERPYIAVLKRTSKGLRLDDYSKTKFVVDVTKLRKYFVNRWSKNIKVNIIKPLGKDEVYVTPQLIAAYIFNWFLEYSITNAKVDTSGGYIWNITRMLALVETDYRMFSKKKTVDVGSDEWPRSNIKHISFEDTSSNGFSFSIDVNVLKKQGEQAAPSYGNGDFETNLISDRSTTIEWNTIFRKVLGYEYVEDYGDEIIHENEPIQAVFFSNKAFKVIDAFDNKPSKRPEAEDSDH